MSKTTLITPLDENPDGKEHMMNLTAEIQTMVLKQRLIRRWSRTMNKIMNSKGPILAILDYYITLDMSIKEMEKRLEALEKLSAD